MSRRDSTRLIPENRTVRFLAGLAMITMLGGCGTNREADRDWSIVVDTLANGVVTVSHVPPATGIEPTWRLNAELTIGRVEGPGADAFGQIRGVAPVHDGGIAVLDAQVQELQVFGPNGEYLRTLGSRGEGPGELNNANGLLVGSDGRLRVHDPGNARISFFDPDHGFTGSTRLEIAGFLGFIWNAVIAPDDRIHEATLYSREDGLWHAVKTYDAEGTWVDTVWVEPLQRASPESPRTYAVEVDGARRSISIPFWPQEVRALDPGGIVWTKPADRNVYQFVQTTFERDTLRIVEIERTMMSVPPPQRDAAIASVRESAGGQELDWTRIPSEMPTVEAAFVDDQQQLWVKVARPENGTTYDVFGQDGRYQGTVVTDLRISARPRPVVIDNTMYAVSTDELDVQYVIRASIQEVEGSGQ